MSEHTQQVQQETAPVSELLRVNMIVPACVAHHFISRHRSSVYAVVRERRVKVKIIQGVEFVSLFDLVRYFENTKPGRKKKLPPNHPGQRELHDIWSDDSSPKNV